MTNPTNPDRARAALGLAPATSNGAASLSPVDRLIARTRNMEVQFRDAVASGLSPERLVRDAITAVRSNDKLAECSEQSFFGALMTAAQLGLRPNVSSLGHGWILPYWSRKANDGRGGHEAQWILGYQGMVELGYRSGMVQKITAATVYEGDPVFRVQRGTTDELVHEPTMDPTRRGRPIAHYAVVWLSTGRALWEAIPDGDAQRIMERFAARNRQNQIVGPWRDDYEAMARKTAMRGLWRWMPKTEVMSLALATDGATRDGIDADPVEPAPATITVQVAEPAAPAAQEPQAALEEAIPANDPTEPATAATEPPSEEEPPAEDEPAVMVMPDGERRQAMEPNALRRGLLSKIEQRHGAGWLDVCAQQHDGVVIPAAYLTAAELRAIADAPAGTP